MEAKQAWHQVARQSSSEQHPCPWWELEVNTVLVAAVDNREEEEVVVADNQTAEVDETRKQVEWNLEMETVVTESAVRLELPTEVVAVLAC